MMAKGIARETIAKWSVDPQVTHPEEGRGSVFDLLEDLDVEECLAKCLTIKK